MNEPRYLVYNRSFGGRVAPEIWHGERRDGAGKSLLSATLQYRMLSHDEYNLSLTDLASKYPYKEKSL